jgi:hypothetical protein
VLIVDVSEVKLPGEAKLNNLPPECGEPIDADENGTNKEDDHNYSSKKMKWCFYLKREEDATSDLLRPFVIHWMEY